MAAFLVVLSLWPALALAQQSPAGVVTTIQGVATVARTAVPQELPLKFKDAVFYRDRITTRENSIVRVLMGGKALVTVRELSVLTITEEPGRATVNLESGKIALAVSRRLMRPGEEIQIRTPNAVAAVRGTVVIVEVFRATAAAQLGPAAWTTIVSAVVDSVNVLAAGAASLVTAGFSTNVLGLQPPGAPYPSPPTIFQGLRPPQPQFSQNADSNNEMNKGSALLAALGAGPAVAAPPSAPPPSPPSTSTIGVQETTTTQTVQQVTSTVPTGNVFQNGGFETGDLQGWTVNGAGSVIGQFGSATITPAGGSFMFLGHTGTGAVNLSPCASATDACQRTTLSQTFDAGSVLKISFQYVLLTREGNCTGSSCVFQTDTGASARNDRWQVRLIPSSGSPMTLFETTVQDELAAGTFTQFGQTFTADGFALQPNSGSTQTFSSVSKTVVVSPGSVTLEFSVTDVGDTLFDSGALLDLVVVNEDPPLVFVRDGARLTRTDPAPLFQFTNSPQTFDSALVVCCHSSATLEGPLLKATNSDLTVGFSLLSLLQDGTLTTSSADPLVLLEGGTHSLGAAVGVFDIAGVNTAVDPQTGLAVGTDRPLQHGGVLLETSGATVTTQAVLKLDTALLEASAPLLNLTAGSSLTTQGSVLDLSLKAKVTSLGSLVRLDASTLTVNNGSLFNVAGGSVLSVTGSLVSLANGSTLNILNGSLLSVSGGSVFTLTGGSLSTFGSGTNSLNITNTSSLCSGCSLTTSIPNFSYPVLLANGATAANVQVSPGFTPFAGLSASNTVKVSGTSGAVLTVSGSTSKVTLAP